MFELVLFTFEDDSGGSFSVDCLDDLRIAVLNFTDIGLSNFNILSNFVQNVLQVFVLNWELFFKFMDDFFTGLDKDTAGFVDVVDLVYDYPGAVAPYQRCLFELEVPR